jgi:hypothetical protein
MSVDLSSLFLDKRSEVTPVKDGMFTGGYLQVLNNNQAL